MAQSAAGLVAAGVIIKMPSSSYSLEAGWVEPEHR